ncbi:MAG: potassium channel family protein [Desulfovibrionaceae bacterium]|jgi:voltage-gated potassium channel
MKHFGFFTSSLGKLVAFIFILLIASSICFYFVELKEHDNGSLLNSIWWVIVTITTVGYGDIVPQTPLGKFLGVLVMLSGIGLVSALTGNIASVLVEKKAKQRKGFAKVNIKNHIIIFGWNIYTLKLVQTIIDSNTEDKAQLVLVNTLEQQQREEILGQLNLEQQIHFVYGNISKEAIIRKANPQYAKVIYIVPQGHLSPNEADQETIYCALAIRSMAQKIPIYSTAALSDNQPHLVRAGVNEVMVQGELDNQVLGLMGANPSIWSFILKIFGDNNNQALKFEHLGPAEKEKTWGELIERLPAEKLPIALCKLPRTIALADVLDKESALDQFILELFKSAGQKTQLGSQRPDVKINPSKDTPLSHYDMFLYLKTC